LVYTGRSDLRLIRIKYNQGGVDYGQLSNEKIVVGRGLSSLITIALACAKICRSSFKDPELINSY